MQTRAKSIDLMPEIQEACAADLALKCSSIESTKKGEVNRNFFFFRKYKSNHFVKILF
jgi:hypothetical protein